MGRSAKKEIDLDKEEKEIKIEDNSELEVQSTFNESTAEELIDEEGSVENVSY